MGNGIIFDGGVPDMKGTWFNPRTGDKIVVRDTFFSDNQYMVQTMDGRLLGYNTLQNYIRDDSPSKQPTPAPTPKQKTVSKPASAPKITVDPDMLLSDEDLAAMEGTQSTPANGPVPQGMPAPATMAPTVPVPMTMADLHHEINDFDIIDRALIDASMPKIKIDVTVDWKNMPSEQVSMLKSMMGVSEGDIISYILRKTQGQIDIQRVADTVYSKTEDTIKNKLSTGSEDEKKATAKAAPKKSSKR